ncbi:MAG: riboflavin biosynthesis protein RibF [Chloroflexota bacterium]|nr:riboflavin biosynthesis protein RibF [Chloroflexota bacterium]
MTAYRYDALPSVGPAVMTLGVFDGVHVGHRHLVTETHRAAQAADARSVVLVFSPHPDEVIRPGYRVPRLLPPAVTLDRLRGAGVDHVLEVQFDDEVRSLAPEDFLDGLAPSLDLRAVVMCTDSAFGRGRAGTLERVGEIGRERGFEAIGVDLLLEGGAPMSSSRIRAALAGGDVVAAARHLLAPPLLRGTVVHGDQRGRELGFPTANLAFDYHPALPALGIYLGRVACPERSVGPGHPALVSVGVRPTFHDDGRVLVEVYLLDWEGDLYDTTLDVELVGRLREERRFDSVDALVGQMRRDEQAARARLGVDGG